MNLEEIAVLIGLHEKIYPKECLKSLDRFLNEGIYCKIDLLEEDLYYNNEAISSKADPIRLLLQEVTLLQQLRDCKELIREDWTVPELMTTSVIKFQYPRSAFGVPPKVEKLRGYIRKFWSAIGASIFV